MAKKNFDENIHEQINREYHQVTRGKKPKILLCTPEITELPEGMGNAANYITAKGGGLGDISASLINYLNKESRYELHIALPKYDSRIKGMAKITNTEIDRLAIILSGQGIHLVNDSAFSYIDNPYQEHQVHTSIRRAYAFQRYVINDLIDRIEPDVIHCNDWMTSLIPPAAKAKGIKSIFTLHNIFTEKQTLKEIELSGIRPMDFAENLFYENYPENIIDDWGKHYDSNPVDFTASAIYACDYFNTVSPTFLKELVNNTFGDLVPAAISKSIKEKYAQGKALGILNAPSDKIDSRIFPNIINFSANNLMEKKELNKMKFQEEMGLPIEPTIPLFFWPNRLYFQKAPDLLLKVADFLIHKYQMQIAVVANGDKLLEEKFKSLDKRHRNIAYLPFDENLSNLGKAGADFILMPSRYEPCGLPQMEVPRLGTLPIVRATGGLKDTVQHLDFIKGAGNGFVFKEASRADFEFGIKEALMFYAQPRELRKKNLKRIMRESSENYNLEKTASEYMRLYDELIKGADKR